MKTITAIGVATLGAFLPLAAQTTTTTETTEVRPVPGSPATTTETTTTTTFNPEARTKVVTYFDTYKTNPHGLPPAWVTKVKGRKVPATWRTSRISPGVVVTEEQRSYLIDAPADLVQVLPPSSQGVRYYVAGSNVVAVDSSYKVVDSIQIPTIKYEDQGDEIEIETQQGGRKVEIEVDKDDGEVEIEKEDD